ncbi:MAG: type 2 isopentenyl-diphosphate Delta-isomerase [Holosporaceae bacterium]|nr:type 2 isopentenyl-diphosphate Delta-isomerase [Holosporaceae bacterium]
MNKIQQKKKDNVSLAGDPTLKSMVDAGFSRYHFEHNALPEVDFAEIDTSVNFLNHCLKLPMIISSIMMDNSCERINRNLAGIASDFGLGMSVGSQRIAIEDPSFENSFKIRRYAPNVLLFANLGAVQLNHGYSVDECRRAVDMIEADALILHLNPIQEVFQIDGSTNFSGLLKKIEKVCSALQYPVLVKEVGYGISASVAKRLQNAGVYGVDVAGAGSTSWSALESRHSRDIVTKNAARAFIDWGNTTVDCIKSIAEMKKGVRVIASGGVKCGVDMAKAIALGADVCGNAMDFLQNILISRSSCENFVESLILELKTTMLCIGCHNVQELKAAKILKVEW